MQKDGTQLASTPEAGTGPGPLFGALDEASPHRVAFRITQDGEQVLVLFDGKGFEASRNVTKVPTLTYESILSRSGLRPG
jgi:hypothetical protein